MVCRRGSQTFSQNFSMKRLNLLAGNLIETLTAEFFRDTQAVQLLVTIPATLPRLYIWQVVLIEKRVICNNRQPGLFLSARIGAEGYFSFEYLGLLTGFC